MVDGSNGELPYWHVRVFCDDFNLAKAKVVGHYKRSAGLKWKSVEPQPSRERFYVEI